MSNDFLAKGYFDDELEFLSKPVYERMLSKLSDTLLAIKTSESASIHAVKRLSTVIIRCEDPYHLLKLLLMAHIMIDGLSLGRLYLLEVLSQLNLNWLRPKCKFDKHLTKTLLRNYIDYLMKMCSACEIYTHCTTIYRSDTALNQENGYEEESLHMYFHGALNIIRCCWPLLNQLRKLEGVLAQTYPFLLDVYMIVGRETYAFARTIHDVYDKMEASHDPLNQFAWQTARSEIMNLQENLQNTSSSDFLTRELEVSAPHQPECIAEIFQETIKEFMSSQGKHIDRNRLETVWSPS